MLKTASIKCVEDVLKWFPNHCIPQSFAINLEKWEKLGKKKMIVCHDMKGGYLEGECSLEGCSNDKEYLFWHWWQIDTFIYFSHDLVTIPPAPWVEAAHKHGVKILGTFITEWEKGSAICSEILKSVETSKKFADKLVELSSYYGFDGWLLNIENELNEEEVYKMLEFTKYLSKKQHEAKNFSKVLWYDSVTLQGKLEWQNELNSLNLDFFKACDGIFLNYTWKEDNLNESLKTCIENDRPLKDVYVGVDIFARNCIGGFESYKSVQLIRSKDLSTALFAPGWTHEKFKGVNFEDNENRFWRSFQPCEDCRYLISLPLVTSFNMGKGKHYSSFGKVLKKAPWFNLAMQSLQGVYEEGVCVVDDVSFIGGTSLRISSSQPQLKILFPLNVTIEAGESFYVFYVMRECIEKSSLVITLTTEKDGTNENEITYLFSGSETRDNNIIKKVERISSVEKEFSDKWRLIAYRLENDEALKLLNVGAFATSDAAESVAYLGYLQVSKTEPCLALNSKEFFVTLIKQNGKLDIMKNESIEKLKLLKIVEESDSGFEGNCSEKVKSVYLVWDDGEFALRGTGKLFNIFIKNIDNNWEFICFSPTSILRLDKWVKNSEVEKLEMKIEEHYF